MTSKTNLAEFQKKHHGGLKSFKEYLEDLNNDKQIIKEMSGLDNRIKSSEDGGKIAQMLSEQMILLGKLIIKERER